MLKIFWNFVTESLRKFKIPHSVEFTDELPRSLQGKLLKYQIREKFMEEKAK